MTREEKIELIISYLEQIGIIALTEENEHNQSDRQAQRQ